MGGGRRWGGLTQNSHSLSTTNGREGTDAGGRVTVEILSCLLPLSPCKEQQLYQLRERGRGRKVGARGEIVVAAGEEGRWEKLAVGMVGE